MSPSAADGPDKLKPSQQWWQRSTEQRGPAVSNGRTHLLQHRSGQPGQGDSVLPSASHAWLGFNGSTLTAVPARAVRRHTEASFRLPWEDEIPATWLRAQARRLSSEPESDHAGQAGEDSSHGGGGGEGAWGRAREAMSPTTLKKRVIEGLVRRASVSVELMGEIADKHRTFVLNEAHCRSVIATAKATQTAAQLMLARERLSIFSQVMEDLRQLIAEMNVVVSTVESLVQLQRKWLYIVRNLSYHVDLQSSFPHFELAVDFDMQVRVLLEDLDMRPAVHRLVRNVPGVLSGPELQAFVEKLLSAGNALSREMDQFVFVEVRRRVPELWFLPEQDPSMVMSHHFDVHKDDVKTAMLQCFGGAADFLFMDPSETHEKDLDEVSCCIYGLVGGAGDHVVFQQPVLVRRTEPLSSWFTKVSSLSKDSIRHHFFRSLSLFGLYAPPESKCEANQVARKDKEKGEKEGEKEGEV